MSDPTPYAKYRQELAGYFEDSYLPAPTETELNIIEAIVFRHPDLVKLREDFERTMTSWRALKEECDWKEELLIYVRHYIAGEVAAYGNCTCDVPAGDCPCAYCASIHFVDSLGHGEDSHPFIERIQEVEKELSDTAAQLAACNTKLLLKDTKPK